MEKATYPIKSCREAVWSGAGLGYPCELANLHTGPCASFSVAESVTRRDRWEAENPSLAGKSSDGDIIIDSKGNPV